MYKMRFTCAILVACVAVASAAPQSYNGYKVFDITPETEDQLVKVNALEGRPGIDFWSQGRAGQVSRVMVEPKREASLALLLKISRIPYTISIRNVEEVFMKERVANSIALIRSNGKISFTAYHRFATINAYLDEMAATYPSLVKVATVGNSHEGRVMKTIRISNGGGGTKPLIVIDAGIHAREWAAPSVALYIINQLVENSSSNMDLLNNVDWLILPVANPDGYEYTHSSVRLWRKTRRPNSGSSCVGTDPNRNFDFHWNEVGASTNPCSEIFAGQTAFSEPETRIIRDIVRSESRAQMYLTFHSYGNYVLYPWGYTSSLPTNWPTLDALGKNVANAIQAATGTRYTVGSSTNVLYAAAGGSDDYALGVAGIPMSYTIELPGGGSSGFDLPPSAILSMVRETFIGVRVFAQYFKNS